MHNIGDKIQQCRQKSALSQEALAEKIGVSRQTVSKWELGQSQPEVDKIIAMSRLFSITTDELLYALSAPGAKTNLLSLSSIYLIVKDMDAAISFYEKLLTMRLSTRHPGFAEFFFDNSCIALMDEKKLQPSPNQYQACTNATNKFVLNFCVKDLTAEHMRLKSLDIGPVTAILQAHADYYYIQIRDPDNNVIEITGQVYDTRRSNNMDTIYCQSCAMAMKEDQYGTLADGTKTNDYCHYCYKDGDFTTQQTLDEAVESNIQFWLANCNNDPDQARTRIREVFTTLKRWQ